jgi:hypothetical protein
MLPCLALLVPVKNAVVCRIQVTPMVCIHMHAMHRVLKHEKNHS